MIICQTSRYRFEINYDEKTFSLLAISLPDGHCSNINTLNETLSAFDIDEDSLLVGETDWHGSEREVRVWVQTAIELFGDREVVVSFELALDRDRREGEWENVVA